jgi:hypothetical protein
MQNAERETGWEISDGGGNSPKPGAPPAEILHAIMFLFFIDCLHYLHFLHCFHCILMGVFRKKNNGFLLLRERSGSYTFTSVFLHYSSFQKPVCEKWFMFASMDNSSVLCFYSP